MQSLQNIKSAIPTSCMCSKIMNVSKCSISLEMQLISTARKEMQKTNKFTSMGQHSCAPEALHER